MQSVIVSARDLSGHTKLKFRHAGQNSHDELQARDLKAELLARERLHYDKAAQEKARTGGLLTFTGASTTTSSAASNTAPVAAAPAEGAPLTLQDVDFSQFDDADADVAHSSGDDDDDNSGSDSGSESDSDDDSEDEEAELMRELERLKAERAAEKAAAAAEARAQAEAATLDNADALLAANPLIAAELGLTAPARDSSLLKRRWDDDVVFRNQARDTKDVQKRVVNDVVRSDFHRSFLKKYMR